MGRGRQTECTGPSLPNARHRRTISSKVLSVSAWRRQGRSRGRRSASRRGRPGPGCGGHAAPPRCGGGAPGSSGAAGAAGAAGRALRWRSRRRPPLPHPKPASLQTRARRCTRHRHALAVPRRGPASSTARRRLARAGTLDDAALFLRRGGQVRPRRLWSERTRAAAATPRLPSCSGGAPEGIGAAWTLGRSRTAAGRRASGRGGGATVHAAGVPSSCLVVESGESSTLGRPEAGC